MSIHPNHEARTSCKRRSCSVLWLISLLIMTPLFLFAGGEKEGPAQSDQSPVRVLRIGVLPDADSLPILLAERDAMFSPNSDSIEVIRFQSPVERDAAFQAGVLDGFVGDTLGALYLEQAGIDITITSITSGRYGLAAAPGSSDRISDLAGIPIGISSNTIIAYVVDRILSDPGISFPADKIVTLPVPKMPVRMELLLQGELGAACLPEPLYSLVLAQGAVPLADSGLLRTTPGVMIFSTKAVQEARPLIDGFYDGYMRASAALNTNPDDHRDFLVETCGFPAPVRDSFEFPTYAPPRLPTISEIEDVVNWMLEKSLISAPPVYTALIGGYEPAMMRGASQ